MENEVMYTGIKSFDYLLYNGIPNSSAIIVEGPPGIGKTTFGIQYLYEGIHTYGEKGVFITFEELPMQIYRDMMQYGWDLKELEATDQLRVISMHPKTFLRELLKPQGLIETILKQIDCKRVVIDSISLFKYGNDEEHIRRDAINSIHNALAKFGLTVLYLRESWDKDRISAPFIHFVMDGVIQLSFKDMHDGSKVRTIEIKKMRGTKYVEGEHIFRMYKDGIRVLKSKRVPEKLKMDSVTTGIESLDHYLGGGIAKGTTWLFDIDSISSSRELLTSIFASRAKAGENFMYHLSPSSHILELEELMNLHGVSLKKLAQEGRAIIYEQFERTMPAEFKDLVVHLHDVKNDDYLRFILEHGQLPARTEKGESWFVYFDINASIAGRGKRFVMRALPKIISLQKQMNLTLFIHCNTRQIDEDMLAVLKRGADGVIRIWTEEYQYMKIEKSPNGLVSEPLVLEIVDEAPFIQIL